MIQITINTKSIKAKITIVKKETCHYFSHQIYTVEVNNLTVTSMLEDKRFVYRTTKIRVVFDWNWMEWRITKQRSVASA